MDVPGKRPGCHVNTPVGEEEIHVYYCNPCNLEGRRLLADGYCQTCRDYLCQDCFRIHTRPTPMKHHVLLSREDMPKVLKYGPQVPFVKSTIACKDHADKVIEFYCPTHECVECPSCADLRHKQCDVRSVPKIAIDFNHDEDYIKFKADLDNLDKCVDSLRKDATHAFNEAIESNEKAVDGVRKFRTEIVSDLDTKEKKLIQFGNKLKALEEKRLRTVDAHCLRLKTEIGKLKTRLASFEQNVSDLFVMTKQSASSLGELQQQMEQLSMSLEVSQFSFERNQAYTYTLVSKINLGSINKVAFKIPKNTIVRLTQAEGSKETRSFTDLCVSLPQAQLVDFSKVRLSHVSTITAKTSLEKGVCNITGMVFLGPSSLLVVDNCDRHASVKTIDTTTNTVTASVQMSSKPWDIALLPGGEAAVTLPHEKRIQVVSTGKYMSLVRTIKVGKKCLGIDATVEKLVVSYVEPGKVEVLNHKGKRIKSIKIRDIYMPRYIMIRNEDDAEVIYVSDNGTHKITKVTLESQILQTYSDGNLSWPQAMAFTPSGYLIICSPLKTNVHIVSMDLKKICTLLNPAEVGGYFRSVYFSDEDNKLYIGCDAMDTLKVIHLRETFHRSLEKE